MVHLEKQMCVRSRKLGTAMLFQEFNERHFSWGEKCLGWLKMLDMLIAGLPFVKPENKKSRFDGNLICLRVSDHPEHRTDYACRGIHTRTACCWPQIKHYISRASSGNTEYLERTCKGRKWTQELLVNNSTALNPKAFFSGSLGGCEVMIERISRNRAAMVSVLRSGWMVPLCSRI